MDRETLQYISEFMKDSNNILKSHTNHLDILYSVTQRQQGVIERQQEQIGRLHSRIEKLEGMDDE